jgi:serine/threonine protein phosphatase 1
MARWAISDIHGCAKTLLHLVDEVLQLGPQDALFILGDLVNKGPDSPGVLRTIYAWIRAGRNITLVKGNHDLHFVNCCRSEDPAHFDLIPDITRQAFGRKRAYVPEAWIDMLEAMPHVVQLDDAVLVHAGLDLRAKDPWAETAEQLVLCPDYSNADLKRLKGKRLIHGHLARPLEQLRREAKDPSVRVLGIDTGCWAAHLPEFGTLAAVNLDTWEVLHARNREPLPCG